MAEVATENLFIYKGANRNIIVSMTGTYISGDALEFKVFEYHGSSALITKTTADVAEIKETVAGVEITIYITPADTQNMEMKRYYYELWHTDSDGDTMPSLAGFLYVSSVSQPYLEMVRGRLQEAGDKLERIVLSEYRPVVGSSIVNTKSKNIVEVHGVWLTTDSGKTGTNYFTGGSFDRKTGAINLGTPTPNPYIVVLIDYTWSSGLTDSVILDQLELNRIFCIGYTGIKFFYGQADTEVKNQVEQMSLARTIISCVWVINSPNSAQLGYNFRIDEFEFQSKLWGEGMIAQSLFLAYKEHYEEWKQIIGKDIKTTLAPKNVPRYSLKTILGDLGQDAG